MFLHSESKVFRRQITTIENNPTLYYNPLRKMSQKLYVASPISNVCDNFIDFRGNNFYKPVFSHYFDDRLLNVRHCQRLHVLKIYPKWPQPIHKMPVQC